MDSEVGQLSLLETDPLPPCSLCRSPSFRAGCVRCESRRWLFLRPRPPPRMDAINRWWAAREQAEAERRAHLAGLGRPVRVALLGCGKAKLDRPAPAAQLYTGSLFRQALRYGAQRFDQRYVLSALHGLVALEKELEPYELALKSLRRREREAWGARVAQSLASLFAGFEVELTFLCGRDYADEVRWRLPPTWQVSEPLRGLGLGQRLAMLKELAGTPDATPRAQCSPSETVLPPLVGCEGA